MSSALYICGLFCCHATSSVSMILLNKTISQSFNFPWTTILFQNLGTVLLGYMYSLCCTQRRGRSSDAADDVTARKSAEHSVLGLAVPWQLKNKLWLVLQTFFFIATLFTSLRALHYISVPLYMVARNSVPACTALLEYFVDGTRTSLVGSLGLICAVLGAVIYTASDAHVEFTGFSYAVAQVLIVACCSVVDKASVRIQSKEEGILPVEVNQIRVVLSVPFNLLLILASELHRHPSPGTGLLTAVDTQVVAVFPWLLLSTVFGFGVGTSNFNLQREVSATTVQVANISYKLVTTILSCLTHPSPVTLASWIGYIVSLAGIAVYTFGPKLISAEGADMACWCQQVGQQLLHWKSKGAARHPDSVELQTNREEMEEDLSQSCSLVHV